MLISEVSRNDIHLVPETQKNQKILLMLNPGAFEVGFQSSLSKRITYNGGETILLPRHRPMWLRGIEATFVAVSISDASLTHAAQQTTEVELCCSSNLNNPTISALMATIHAEMRAGYPHGQLFLDSLEQALANALFLCRAARVVTEPIYHRSGLSPARLRKVVEFVQAHLSSDLTLDTLAKKADLSTSYFCQMFRTSTGKTPHQFLLDQRMLRAQELLQGPDVTISNVASACGFRSSQHFARLFRRIVGVTPRQYRWEYSRE